MSQIASRHVILFAGALAAALAVAGCSSDDAPDTAASQVSSAVTSVSHSASPTVDDAAKDTAVETTTEATSAARTDVTIMGERDVEVTLTGPIAAKYKSAAAAQKSALGKPSTGDHNAGTRESGAVFQQFQGGVIIAKNDKAGTTAYVMTSGKIRDAWNTERAADGTPSLTGTNGSAGPLGAPTSDVTTNGDVQQVTFEHGKITETTKTGKVVVTVKGKVVPAGLK